MVFRSFLVTNEFRCTEDSAVPQGFRPVLPCCIQARGMLMEGLEGGYRRYRCKIEREWCWACVSERERVWVSVWAFVCVRRFHGNLSGVCLVPGDRERERERWETRRKLSLVKGWGEEWDKLMGGVRWDCLRPSVFPYHPINLLLFIFSNPDRLPFPFPFLTSLTLFPCKEISRLAVSVSCVTWEDFWVITKCTKLIWGNHRATTVFSWLNSQSTFTLPQCNPQLVILTMTVFLTSTALPIKLSPPCFCPSLWVRKLMS